MISGTIVFLLGIAANEAIMHLRRHWPKTVRWSASEIQKDYVAPIGLPPANVQVEVGMCEDGSFVWRPKQGEGQAVDVLKR